MRLRNLFSIVVACCFVTFFLSGAFSEDTEAIAQRIYTSDKLLISQSTGSTLSIPSGITEINTYVSFVPKTDFRQAVLEQSVTPNAQQLGEVLNIAWNRPAPGSESFLIETSIRTSNEYLPIYDKVRYPLDKTTIPNDYDRYLASSENIDINDAIQSKALELAGDSDDLYVISHNIATWVEEEIEYDLSTVAAEVAQSASWTLENKIGVCDELTSLFIAMMRSLDVPARFVAGISYTNSPLFEEPWGPHAWAEVYFPGYGWVPFDLTYRQFGHIDASHVALKTSTDADQSFTRYTWKGSGNKVVMDPLTFSTEIEAFLGEADKQVDLSIEALHDEVALDSSNGAVVTLKNRHPHYVSVYLQLISSQEIEIPQYEMILLAPLEEKTLTYDFTLSNLDDKFIYTFPLEARSLYGEQDEVTFKAARQHPRYDQSVVEEQLSSLEQEGSSLYEYTCSVEPFAIAGQPLQLVCQVSSTSDTMRMTTVCLNEYCEQFELGAKTIGRISTSVTYPTSGTYTLPLSFSILQQGPKTYTVPLVVHGEPTMDITITSPELISFDDETSIDITIAPEGGSQPQNLNVLQYTGIDPMFFDIALLDKTYKLSASLSGSELLPGENTLDTLISYQDLAGNSYNKTLQTTITLQDPSFTQKVQLYLKRWLRTLFS